MGKPDIAVNQMLMRKERFADLMNGSLYGGRQVLSAGDLEMAPNQPGVFYEAENEKKIALERRGDVRMRAELGTYRVILANEFQNKVHLAMPVRDMLYDALEYVRQIQDMEKKHKEEGEKLEGDGFLSGISKKDRLTPVITTVLYFGPEWDGVEGLYEMMGLVDRGDMDELKKYLPDYHVNPIDANHINDVKLFRSCLQHIFSMVKLRKDKKGLYKYLKDHKKDMQKMDSVERMAAWVLSGERKRMAKFLNEREGG